MFARPAAAVSALVFARACGAAFAEPGRGFHLGAEVGCFYAPDIDYPLTGAPNPLHPTTFESGPVSGIQVGYRFEQLRIELELATRRNDAGRFGRLGFPAPGAGRLEANTAMVDFQLDVLLAGGFTPYLGLGIGVARVKADNVRKTIAGTFCCTGVVSRAETDVAGQAIAGSALRVSPQLELILEFRYPTAAATEFAYGVGCFGSGAGCLANSTLGGDYVSRTWTVGARWSF